MRRSGKQKFVYATLLICLLLLLCGCGQSSSEQPVGECMISISCETILAHMDEMDEDRAECVPEDGVILPPTWIMFSEGETVFDVLQRVCKENGIPMEFTSTPAYQSAYIEGINNIYEFDCGNLSGWNYSVNGTFPIVSSIEYVVQEGDVIRWQYTCNLGEDIGGRNDDNS